MKERTAVSVVCCTRSMTHSSAGSRPRLTSGMSAWRPANRVEYSDRVEVVPPVRDLAIADCEHGDIPVGVPAPGTHNVALGGVLGHHDALGRVVVNGHIKTAVKNDHAAVGAVQLSDRGTALDIWALSS
jgi:hypothetical protein